MGFKKRTASWIGFGLRVGSCRVGYDGAGRHIQLLFLHEDDSQVSMPVKEVGPIEFVFLKD